MKTLVFLAGAAVAAVLLAPGAAHGESAYGSVGYAHTRDDDAGADMGALQGRLGVQATPMIGVEAEAARGVNNDDRGKLDSQMGVYGVARAPVSRNLDVHARVGYSRVNEFGRGANAGNNLRDDGVGYGVGAQVNMNERWGVRGDWTRHDGNRDVDTVGASVVRKF